MPGAGLMAESGSLWKQSLWYLNEVLDSDWLIFVKFGRGEARDEVKIGVVLKERSNHGRDRKLLHQMFVETTEILFGSQKRTYLRTSSKYLTWIGSSSRIVSHWVRTNMVLMLVQQ